MQNKHGLNKEKMLNFMGLIKVCYDFDLPVGLHVAFKLSR